MSSCLHQIQTASALARFAAAASSLPAADEFLLLEDAVCAWPEFAVLLAGRSGAVLETDLALSGMDPQAFVSLTRINDLDWPLLLKTHRRCLCWS